MRGWLIESYIRITGDKKAAAAVTSNDVDAVLILTPASSLGPWNGYRGYMNVIAG